MAGKELTGREEPNMRFSNYNILSEKLDTGGYAILNGLSGAIDVISDSLYNFIIHAGHRELSEVEVGDLGEDVTVLIERGYITTLNSAKEIDYATELAKKMDSEDRNELMEPEYSLLLIPNYNCNYRCVYCFERDNEYMREHKDSVLSIEQIDAFFKFTDEHPAEKAITLYGGEPLSNKNLELIDYIVNQGQVRGFNFYAITNGHDLDAFIPYLGTDKIQFLQITLDGPKRIHDKRRISLDKTSSYEHIMTNIKRVLSIEGVEILLRINIDKTNVDTLDELIGELTERQIYPHDRVKIVGGLVTGAGEISISYDEVSTALSETIEKYPAINNFMDLPSLITEQINTSLSLGIPFYRRISACSVPEKMLIFAPDWNIYSCSDYVGKPEFAIGTYDSKGLVTWNRENRSLWMGAKVYYNISCIQCPYAFICAGGCHKHIYKGVSYEQGRCDFYKKTFPQLLANTVNTFLINSNGSVT